MKKIVLLGLFSLFTFYASAQDARGLLNEVMQKVKNYENITIDFKYILMNSKENIKQETRGDVVLEGDKYVLNMMGTTRIFDGKNVYTIVPEDEEVTISAYSAKEDKEITPSRMLTFYEKGYHAKLDITQNVKGRKIQYIKLTPTDPKSNVKNVLLGIDAQTKHIYKLIHTDDEGTQFTVTVNSFKTNQPLSKTLFSFDEAKYKKDGYYINKI